MGLGQKLEMYPGESLSVHTYTYMSGGPARGPRLTGGLAVVRRAHALYHEHRRQPQRRKHVRLRVSGPHGQDLVSRLVGAQLHDGGARQGRQLRRVLPRRGQAVPRHDRRRQNGQGLGLPQQELRSDDGEPHQQRLVCRLPPQPPDHHQWERGRDGEDLEQRHVSAGEHAELRVGACVVHRGAERGQRGRRRVR